MLGKAASLGLEIGCEAQASMLDEIRVDVLTEEGTATSAIEGERIDRESVRSAVARQLGLTSPGLPPSERYVEGLVGMIFDATSRYAAPLRVERLKGWQAALFPTGFSGVHRISVGDWRHGMTPVAYVPRPGGTDGFGYEAIPPEAVEAEMRRFLGWWEESRDSMEGLLRAGMAHFWFVTVRPFDDGNGRIARALTDMALAQDEGSALRLYSVSREILADPERYYHVLDQAQRGTGEVTDWLVWFLDCIEQAMVRAESRLGQALAKTRFWQRHGGAALNERQLLVLKALLDAGPGGFEDGLCTRKYVFMTSASRATAQREISNMVRQGLLVKRSGGGRSTSYDAAWA